MQKALSTLDIARMLGVAVASVSTWIDQDRLKAGRTPGGHRRVLVKDLLEFLDRQKLPIPQELLPTKQKILVVDDEETIAAWVAEEITAEFPDCEVSQAHDGYSAGELVALLQPAVVILDLRMPGVDGFEVCKRIKAREDTMRIVVIAMTAQHSTRVEKRILECGARICLRKPLDRAVLLKEISAALGDQVARGSGTPRR